MIEGKLSNGFTYHIDEEVLDDYEIYEYLSDLDDEETPKHSSVKKAYKMILGLPQYQELKEYLRGDNKRISTTKMLNALQEILELSDVKNALPSDE